MRLQLPKSVIESIFSLGFVQFINLTVPLLLVPILVTRLGIEVYGQIAYSQALTFFMVIVINYGFDLYGAGLIAENKNKPIMISDLVSSVYVCKLFLALVCFLTGLIFPLLFFGEKMPIALYFACSIHLISAVLSPIWVFHGFDNLRFVAYVNFFGQVVLMGLSLLLIGEGSSAFVYPLIFSLVNVCAALSLTFLMRSKLHISFCPVSVSVLKSHLYRAFSYFVPRLASGGNRQILIVLAGLSFPAAETAFYVIAEKVYYLAASVLGVVSQALFPFMIREQNLYVFKLVFIWCCILSLTAAVLLNTVGLAIIDHVLRLESSTLSELLMVFSSGFLFLAIGTMLGYPLLGALGSAKAVNWSLTLGSVISFVFAWASIMVLCLHGLALSVVAGAFFVCVVRLYLCARLGLYRAIWVSRRFSSSDET